jgi:hypothetical protein
MSPSDGLASLGIAADFGLLRAQEHHLSPTCICVPDRSVYKNGVPLAGRSGLQGEACLAED